jgi:phage shock protein C
MISDEIKRLHELHQAGALTDAEFEQAKAKSCPRDGEPEQGRSTASCKRQLSRPS